jgi:hypothetical protein
MEEEINIIYFIWLNKDRNWSVIIEGQLFDIISSNILEKSYLNIIISCENNDLVSEAVSLINKYLINHTGKYNIELYNENCYEYYGIRKLYECAKKNPKSIYIYFHTKGMFNWYVMGKRQSLNTEPYKRDVKVKGDGPYKYIV